MSVLKHKKLLLLSDIPPCTNYTGGLVVAQQCRFLPPERLCAFVVLNPLLTAHPAPDLAGLETLTVEKPSEAGTYHYGSLPIGTAGAALVAAHMRRTRGAEILRMAERFAREQGVDAIWAILEGQVVTGLAAPLAQRLGVPLYTQVWDPLSWWLDAHKVDPLSRFIAHRSFDAAMSKSRACAAASWNMAEEYLARYGVRSVPVIAGHDMALAQAPAPRLHGDDLVIGFAGQLYANDAWESLIAALHRAGWRIGGRNIRLTVIGQHYPPDDLPADRLDYPGWLPQADTIRMLAERCDVLYCPYSFENPREDVARLSFPSKLTSYFAAGRPVLVHAPDFSSPARYAREHEAGYVCGSLDPDRVIATLQTIAADGALFERLARNGQAALRRDFTLERMRQSFLDVLNT